MPARHDDSDSPDSSPQAAEETFLGVKRSLISFLAGSVIPILVFVGTLIGLAIQYWPRDVDQGTVADRVSDCIERHNMLRSEGLEVGIMDYDGEEAGDLIQTRTFQRCTWPPNIGADPDGYQEFKADLVVGWPGTSEAEGVNLADRITAPCERIRVSYTEAAMGTQTRTKPFEASAGTIVTYPRGDPPEGDRVPFYFGPEEVVILHFGKANLDDIRCVDSNSDDTTSRLPLWALATTLLAAVLYATHRRRNRTLVRARKSSDPSLR